jgi:hypothetical protein
VVFAVVAILLIAAVILSACLKEVPLRLVSGNQARAQASASEGAVAPVGAVAEPVGAVRASAAGDTLAVDGNETAARPTTGS